MNLVLSSIQEGLTPGDIYVNTLKSPTIAVIWDLRSSVYFGSSTSDEKEMEQAGRFVKDCILKDIDYREHFHLKLNTSSQKWQRVLMDILQDYDPTIRDRFFFRHSLASIPQYDPIEEEITIQEITHELLEDNPYQNASYVIQEIKDMWGSLDKFYQSGFGFVATRDQQILGWCTMEYWSHSGICGIGIETLRRFQNKKIASALATAFLNKCDQQNLIPHWDCWKSNLPSIRLAEKTGFNLAINYQVIALSR